MGELKVGDRVRLRLETAGSFLDPKAEMRVRRQRAATIIHIIGTAIPERKRSFLLDFDQVGQEKAFQSPFGRREIERLPTTP